MKVIIIEPNRTNSAKACPEEMLYQKLIKLGVDVVTIPENDTENKVESLFEKLNYGSKPLIDQPLTPRPQGFSHQEKSKGLAKLLLQHTTPLDGLVQNLSKREKGFHRQRKIGQVSLEECLLYQTSTLLWLLSEHVIPHLEK